MELMKKGIDAKIISLYECDTPLTKRLLSAGAEIIFLDKKVGVDLSIVKKLRKIFKQERPDVVHSHLNAQKYVMVAARKMGIPNLVHTVHSVAEKELGVADRFLAKRFYKKKTIIPVALSEQIQKTIVDVYGVPFVSVPIVSNGVDLSKCMFKKDYAIGSTIEVLHIGRFSQEKNHKGLIDAFKLFHQVKPHSVLTLIGNGDKFDEIKEYVDENGLEDVVRFLGLQTEVHRYIHDADIFVLPSHYEGIPMTLIEAMGTGVPIIATAVGGVPDMLTNGESALLTAVDSQDVADAMLKLANSAELRERLGKNALAQSVAFSSEEMARRYIAIYQGEYK